MKPRPTLRLAATLCALAVGTGWLADPLASQESATTQGPPPQLDDAYFERVAVDIVNVEVYVTDKDGQPVGDLERDDFEIREDGAAVELVNFYRVFDGRPAVETTAEVAAAPALREASTAARAEPALVAGQPEFEVPESQRLHLVVYVDNFHIHPLNRNRVFGRLREFLASTLSRGDQVMVASYDRSLNLRHPFTGDPRLVNAALRELEQISASGNERELERATAIQNIYEAKTLRQALFYAKEFAEAGEFELGRALEGLTELLDSLAGIPGRKMLLHVSDGLPMIPGRDLYQAIQQRFADVASLGEAASRDMSKEFMRVINTANSNRISFYTIDAAGLRVQSGMGAENRAVSSPHVVSSSIDATKRSNLQGSLKLMASRTGGQAIVNTNDVAKGLQRVASDFGNYYSLGYRAPISDRGRYHQIEVRLKDPRRDWEVRHREGYRDKSADNQVADALQAYLVHGYQRNPLGISLDLGEQTASDDGFVNVPVRVRVPVDRLTLLPLGEFYVARLRLYFGAVDENGRDAGGEELPFELRIPRASLEMAKKDEVSRIINAKMRSGTQKLVIAVRDEVSEERSVVGQFVEVQSF